MALPIRVKLTIVFGVVFTSLLFLVASGIFVSLKRDLYSQLEVKLAQDIEKAKTWLDSTQVPYSSSSSAQIENHWWEIWEQGRLIEREKPILGGMTLPALESSCRSTRPTHFTIFEGQPNSREYLVSCFPLSSSKKVIRAFRTTKDIDFFLHRLKWVTVWAFPVLISLSMLLGHYLARRFLAPITRMTKEAERISGENTKERLSILNPKDELGRLGSVLNRSFEDIDQAMDKLKQFTSDVSHELRTPLAALRVTGEVSLTKNRTQCAHRATIESMLEDVEHLNRMVSLLLMLSRADGGQYPYKKNPTDLSKMVKRCQEHLRVLAEEKYQAIQLVETKSPLMANIDEALVQHAIMNVLDNAIKYSPSHSKITVRAKQLAGVGIIEVEDEGEGIPPVYRDRVFDRFYRIDRARSKALGGSGLGLAIAKWAVESSGGQIKIRTDVRKGAIVEMTFSLV